MINPFYFFDENFEILFKINLDSHIIHAFSILSNIPIYPDFGIETKYINKILKEMAAIYARLMNQYKLKYHILFSASFLNIIEEDQRSDETEFLSSLNNNRNLTETDIDNIDVKYQL